MLLRRPDEFELTVPLFADWQSLLCALSLAAQSGKQTTLRPVQKTTLLEPVTRYLATGGVELTWQDDTLAVHSELSTPFGGDEPITDYDAVSFLAALAATRQGSRLSIGVEIDNTLEMVILALQRLGAKLEFKPGQPAIMEVLEPVQRPIRYQLRRESAKITPQLLIAMATIPGRSEISDLFESSRFDNLFAAFIPGFNRVSLVEAEPDDELERRLRKHREVTIEYPSRIEIDGGLIDTDVEFDLPPDTEFAAYLAAGVVSGHQGKLIVNGLQDSDLGDTPLAQLRRMGVSFQPTENGSLYCEPTELKARKVTYEQLHAYPDAVGALALANARLAATTVIRTARFATPREEARRHRLSELVKSLGVKVGEIKDGLVLEGKADLSGDTITSDGDPVGQLMALSACLGTVRQIEIDSTQAALDRWGMSLQPVLDLLVAE